MNLGETVYSRELTWCATRGSSVRERWGRYSGYEGVARQLTVRKARHAYRCTTCDTRIEAGTLHGSTFYDHYCASCVSADEPERQFRAA